MITSAFSRYAVGIVAALLAGCGAQNPGAMPQRWTTETHRREASVLSSVKGAVLFATVVKHRARFCFVVLPERPLLEGLQRGNRRLGNVFRQIG